MANVLFIYGSTSGNTEMVVRRVAEEVEKKHKVDIQRAESADPKAMLKADFCVLASPTYGHGLMQYQMIAFTQKMKELNLSGRRCAVIGLGDDKYDMYYNVESATLLENMLSDMGVQLVHYGLRINKSPIPHLEGEIKEWAQELSKLI